MQTAESQDMGGPFVHLPLDRPFKITLLTDKDLALDEEHVVQPSLVANQRETDGIPPFVAQGEDDSEFRTNLDFALHLDTASQFLNDVITVRQS
ncbi:hypothetical protein SDC9_207409 [bioreactor metagenome]|uniref:Uncharacterized protein n=1 Tax=bioreactor metagenome TaxID=1076179 RepID=A0A645J8I1_9ZZZZ